MVIIWHLLANGCDYEDLGGDYFDNRHVAELEKLGNTVTLEPAAA